MREITSQTVVNAYFQAINRQEYGQAATLFTEDGLLLAPFNESARGRLEITEYLTQKSVGMMLHPQQTKQIGDRVVTVGRVRCPAFWVNVAWEIRLEKGLIACLKVRLLTSPTEVYPRGLPTPT